MQFVLMKIYHETLLLFIILILLLFDNNMTQPQLIQSFTQMNCDTIPQFFIAN